jgi:diguanylate cyclase (GGDEF)-like protein
MTFGEWIKNRPINVKLGLINLITVLISLTPVVCLTLGYEYYSVRRAMLQEAEVQADIIRDNVSAAAAFSDADSAQEILQALRSSPNVIRADLLLPNGTRLASYGKTGTPSLSMESIPGNDQSYTNGQIIRVERTVRLKQDVVGWLETETSMQPLIERLGLYVVVNFLSVLLGFAVAYPLSKKLKESITGPLAELMAVANQITVHQDYAHPRLVNDSEDEVGSLSRAFDDMLSRIQERDVKLSQMAYYDNVTRLTNRHYFMERLNQAVNNCQRYGTRCCLMFIDLDNFKTVNDTLGHHVGDDLLRAVAATLTGTLRDNDILCRIGGDEFAVIIENNKDMVGASVLAQKIINNLSTPMRLHDNDVHIGASIGLSTYPEHATNVADLLRTADTAMYWAKEAGKNRFRIYSTQQENQPIE